MVCDPRSGSIPCQLVPSFSVSPYSVVTLPADPLSRSFLPPLLELREQPVVPASSAYLLSRVLNSVQTNDGRGIPNWTKAQQLSE